MKLLILIITALNLNFAIAQQQKGGEIQSKISGKVIDGDTERPLEYATITIYKAKDSSIVTGTTTDDQGAFELLVDYGNYYVKAEYISYDSEITGAIKVAPEKPVADLRSIKLYPSTSTLNEIGVKAKRSQYKMDLDKKVFNVGQDLSSMGGNASDILENIPSVTVDMDGNVNLRGSSGVRILINGKPSVLLGNSVADALEQLPANSIEKVEVITNPSVRYDAEGMAGIINIILKKERKKGLNGLVNVFTGYPDNHGVNFNFNYGRDKLNLFGSVGGSYRDRPGLSIQNRKTTEDNLTTYLDSDGRFNRRRFGGNFRLGADYSFNSKTTLTGWVGLEADKGDDERTTSYEQYVIENIFTNHFERRASSVEEEFGYDYALSFRKKFDEEEHELIADFQYSSGTESEITDIVEEDFMPDSASENLFLKQKTDELEDESDLTLQLDYVRPINKNIKIEAGYKSIITDADQDNKVSELNEQTDEWEELPNVSNHFIYGQDVHAAYGIFGHTIQKFSYQVGVRAEYTDLQSELIETNEDFSKNYLNFFPSVHISKEFENGLKGQVSYSKRIRRPSVWNLNPFTNYADPLNLWIGNPDLKPELTHSFEVGSIKYWEQSSLGGSIYYRHTTDEIERIRRLNDNGVSITRPENLSTETSFGAEMTFSTNVFKWWRLNGSFNYYRSIMDGGNLGANFTTDFYSWTGRANSQIELGDFADMQFMFNYRGPRQSPQRERKAFIIADIGFRKEILNRKGNIGLKVSDLFNTRKYVSDYSGPGFNIHSIYRRSVRSVVLDFSYRINSYKSKDRKRSDYGGLGEEGGEY